MTNSTSKSPEKWNIFNSIGERSCHAWGNERARWEEAKAVVVIISLTLECDRVPSYIRSIDRAGGIGAYQLGNISSYTITEVNLVNASIENSPPGTD